MNTKNTLFSSVRNGLAGARSSRNGGIALCLFALLMISPKAISENGQDLKSIQELRSLSESVPTVELPAKAAELIQSAKPDQRHQYGLRLVRVFLTKHHSLAPSLVGAICRVAPEISVGVTAEAVKLFPEQSHGIVRSAISAAPEFAARIALQATLDAPDRSRSIRIALRGSQPEALNLFSDLQNSPASQRGVSADLAIETSKNRIEPGRRFPDAPLEVPEDLSGSELDNFDEIGRLRYNQ